MQGLGGGGYLVEVGPVGSGKLAELKAPDFAPAREGGGQVFHFFTLPSPQQITHILSAFVLASILVPRPEQTGQGIVSSFGLRNLGFSTNGRPGFFFLNREASWLGCQFICVI